MSIKLDLEEVCKTSKVTSILRSGLSKLVRYNGFRYIEILSIYFTITGAKPQFPLCAIQLAFQLKLVEY